MTIGVEYGQWVSKIDNTIVKLMIWDTSGQEQYKSVCRIFYRGSNCVLLTYDITREETFNNLQTWLRQVKNESLPDVMLYLIGNRCDLEE